MVDRHFTFFMKEFAEENGLDHLVLDEEESGNKVVFYYHLSYIDFGKK